MSTAAVLIRESCLQDIKARVDLQAVVTRVVAIKGREDDMIGLCPFHQEKSPSFHVHPVSGYFKCFGCGKSGDAIDFVKETEQLTFTAAVEALGARFGITIEYEDGSTGAGNAAGGVIRKAAPKPIETRAPSDTWIRMQKRMRAGTAAEITALAELRRLPATAGLELATRNGQLWFTDVWDDEFDWPAWVITDGARRNAQARRTDGKPWSGIGDKKAKTITGSEATWPVGITEVGEKPEIAFVEGGPDFLAAWHFIWMDDLTAEIAPVTMFGASSAIHPEALPLFRDKIVWLFPHEDENKAGLIGAMAWRTQLMEAGARAVEFYDFATFNVKDLNDLATAHGIPEEVT